MKFPYLRHVSYDMPIVPIITYPAWLQSDTDDGGFIVTFPGLSVFTDGDTEAEAMQNAEEALLCHLEGCLKHDKPKDEVQVRMVQIKLPDIPLARIQP